MALIGSAGTLLTLIFTAVGPILPSLAAHFGGGAQGALVAQTVLSISTAGLIVGYPLWGFLCERLHPRLILAGGMSLYALTGSAGLYIENTALLFATRFVLGLAAAAISSSSVVLIGEFLPAQTQARVLGWSNFAGTVAGVLSSLAAGALVHTGSWRSPFVLYLFSFVFLAGVGCVRSFGRGHQNAEVACRSGSVVGLSRICLGVFAMYIVMFGNFSQLPFLAESRGIVEPRILSRVIAVYTLCLGVGSLLYPPLQSRLPGRFMPGIVIAAMAGGDLFLALASNAVTIAGCAAISAVAGGMLNVYFPLLVIRSAPGAAKGRAVALLFTAMFLGDLVSATVFYAVRRVVDLTGAFLVCAGVLAVTSLVLLVFNIRTQTRSGG